MRLIRLYRELHFFRIKYIQKLRQKDHLWLYINSGKDSELLCEIMKILKTIK